MKFTKIYVFLGLQNKKKTIFKVKKIPKKYIKLCNMRTKNLINYLDTKYS